MRGTRSQRGPLLSSVVMVLLATVATGLLVVIGFQGLPETVVPSTFNDEQHETRHVDVTDAPSVRPTPRATTGRPTTKPGVAPPRSTRVPESVPGSARRPGSGNRPVTRPTTPVPPPARTNPPAPAPTRTSAPPTRPPASPSPTPTCTKTRGKCPKTGPTRQPSGYSASSGTGSGKAAAQPSRTATGRKSTG